MKKRSTTAGALGKRASLIGGAAFLRKVMVKTKVQKGIKLGIIPLVDCHGISEVGRRRQENEDDFLLAALSVDRDLGFDQDKAGKRLVPSPGQAGFLFVVADGVGAVPCGERASSIAVRSLYRYLKTQSHTLEKGTLEISRTLRRGIRRCQSDLQVEGRRHAECDGMSTTLTGVLSLARRLYVVHSGDSRLYLLRGSKLRLMTCDHTQAQLHFEVGTIGGKADRGSPGGNVLWNYVTGESSMLSPDVGWLTLGPGDIYLLCTDGLSDALPAEEIKRHLSSGTSAECIARSLIAAARNKGEGDDLTAIVARYGRPA